MQKKKKTAREMPYTLGRNFQLIYQNEENAQVGGSAPWPAGNNIPSG
jgi:hypothetical protein